jgi:endo-1,4-beta-xylanase
MARFSLFAACLLGSAALSMALEAKGLHELALAAGKFVGTATETAMFTDEPYMRVLNSSGLFGMLVPENSQKWESTERNQGSFTFADSERVRGMAQANGFKFRCHTLTWHSQLPPFGKAASGSWGEIDGGPRVVC